MVQDQARLTELFRDLAVSAPVTDLRAELARQDRPQVETAEQIGSARVRALMARARACLELALDCIESGPQEGTEQPPKSLTNLVNVLAAAIREVELAAETAPGLRLAELADWRLLETAMRTVVELHRQNLFLFECAVAMAGADGELSSLERDVLHGIAERIRLSRPEADALLRRAAEIRPSGQETASEETRNLTRRLYACAVADGLISGAEVPVLKRIAHVLGVSELEASWIMSGGEAAQGLPILDGDAVMGVIRSYGGLPANTLLAADVAAAHMDELTNRMGVPWDEDVLVVYDNRFLGGLFECAALTCNRLFCATPRGENEALDLSLVEGWRRGKNAAILELKDGRDIMMSRKAGPFLQFLLRCVSEDASSP